MATEITEDGEVINTVTWEPIAMAPPFWKTPFNHDTNVESKNTALTCRDPSKTQQQFLKDSDINNILRKFLQTGELPVTGPPTYINQEEEFDLMRQIVTADEVDKAWNALSPEVRNTLRNPQTFVAYVDHCLETGDLEPLRALGLANPLPTPPAPPPEPPRAPAPPIGVSPAPQPAPTAPGASPGAVT